MEVIFIGKAEKDLKEWNQAGNETVLKRIRKLIEEINGCHIAVSVNPNH